ncbi:MAG: YlxR family protein, partial [Mariprofundales bacterium]|nr:YlxR family protein [Mariprofundales bacterium]
MTRQPQRSCDCCRSTMDKGQLLRLVCDDEGRWWPDLRQKAPGRGRYLCLQPACLQRLSDRQVQRIFAGGVTGCGTTKMGGSSALLRSIYGAVEQRVQALMQRMRGRSAVGKDAVLQ